jgi:predicted HAD superfamily phosphohydrolase YqeG
MTNKPRVLVDFDGPIHRYSKQWFDGTAYDEPTEGAKEYLQELTNRGYEVVIFSTRDERQIEVWLRANRFPPYPITNEKLPAVAIIDDRAIRWINWTQASGQLFGLYPVMKENEHG